MALRVTQQSVDVLSEATGGKLRVTQFYVEVLGLQGSELEVSQTLGITDAASATVVGGGINVSASSSLGITDAVSENVDYSRPISDSLGITDAATGVNDVPVSASSALALTDQVNQEFDLSLSDTLALTDIGYQNIKNLSASDALAFVDEAISSIKDMYLNDMMALSDIANDSQHLFASNALGLSDSATQRIKEVSASSSLVLAGAASVVVIHNLADSLGVTDSVSRALVVRRSLADNLAFTQTVGIFINRNGVTCLYSPFVGSGPFTIPTTGPVHTPSTLTLFHPVVSPTLMVVLRNADFGNRIAYNKNRIYRRTRGGTKLVYRKPTWPKFTALTYDVANLDQTQIDAFKSFLNTTLGLQVGIKDHDGLMWKGIIVNPDAEITQTGGRVCAQYATSIQFEGESI